ncbi:hypothetical protein ABL78_4202 [Leptomonas seymouri]|uniref:HECT domain-containing protein n=1 Tax=Leptomonas seymouri TaxID=5684 RepID=A0A0N1HYK9_LEPSE|nr:hypothetical protein ABL78_4202 [Leptomonas seymouri]|eukprot:KPI86732.1 hypothetical protein ABL78_4202 [Leptomonas seymouri]
MDSGTPFCVAPLAWQDGLVRYPSSASQEWNTTPLQPSDYDEDFYNAIVDLERRHKKNEFSEADFHLLGLTFSLMTAKGPQYNLIPNGSEIRVTKSNAHEYFQRVHSAYKSLPQGREMNPPPPPQPPAPVVASPPRLRATSTGLRLTAQDIPSLEWLRWCARNDLERLTLPLGENLRWAVVPRTTEFLIRLRPNGELREVEADEIPLFLGELLKTINEIERAIENFGYYPPDMICTVPAELSEAATKIQSNAPSARASLTPIPPQGDNSNGRTVPYLSSGIASTTAAAVSGQIRRYVPRASPAELEKQRALFSPTHDTGNILAPFQEINV